MSSLTILNVPESSGRVKTITATATRNPPSSEPTPRAESTKSMVGQTGTSILEKRAERSSARRQRWIEANEPKIDLMRLFGNWASPHRKEHERECERQKVAVRYVEKKLYLTPSPGSTWEDYVGEAAADDARNAYRLLVEEVRNGDAKALAALAELTCNAVQELNAATRDATVCEALVPFARKQPAWPMMVGLRGVVGDDPDRRDALLRDLKVGRDTLLGRQAATRFDPTTRLNTVLLKWISEIESLRSRSRYLTDLYGEGDWRQAAIRLKPLTTATAPEWLKCIHALVDEILGDKAETVALLVEMDCKVPSGKTERTTIRKRLAASLDSLVGFHR